MIFTFLQPVIDFYILLNQPPCDLHPRRRWQGGVVTSSGLSDEYINKGPVSVLRSIAQSLDGGPVADQVFGLHTKIPHQ